MSDPKQITSDEVLLDIEQPFRVLAGPGAGKTHWLIHHVRHVVKTSPRLSAVSRVACISYTNTAVNELIRRLGDAADHADVSTIHSFLYHNVVKPYLYLLKKPNGTSLVNYAEVSGHGEHHPSIAKVHSWLKANGDGTTIALPPQFDNLLGLLKRLAWSRSPDGGWSLAPTSSIGFGPHLRGVYTSLKLLDYKSRYWDEGTIDHDDVLYFAYRILEENPDLRGFLAARFRYIFIDEFQDTMPVQSKIVEWLAEHQTVVGVIGDPEQAIYGFLNSKPEHFLNFSLERFGDYRIAGNRRSTGQIVGLLNRVRADGLIQSALRGIDGEPATVYVGELEKVIPEVRSSFPDLAPLWILARANNKVDEIRRLETSAADSDKWKEFEEADPARALFLRAIARGTEVARAQDLAKAVHTLVQGLFKKRSFRDPLKFEGTVTEVLKRGVTLEILEQVVTNYEVLAAGTVLDAYESIIGRIESRVPGLKGTRIKKTGRPREFAEATHYSSLLATVSLSSTDEVRDVRSIHQAKGAEAENVCVYLPDASKVSHLFGPTAGGDPEERRITYVALSRAKNRLVICIPTEHADEDRLKAIGFEVRLVV
jgi:DNA helicase II / ATP-dependent DNA helicase PcrA